MLVKNNHYEMLCMGKKRTISSSKILMVGIKLQLYYNRSYDISFVAFNIGLPAIAVFGNRVEPKSPL